jgi:hypothetical protein
LGFDATKCAVGEVEAGSFGQTATNPRASRQLAS